SRMSVSQMVGQMIQASVEGLTLAEMRRFMPGAIAVSGTWAPDGQASASARERVGVASEFYLVSKQVGAQIPAFWGSGGAEVPFPSAQNFPDNIALGAAGNVEFSRLVGKERALQAVSLGMDFMPLPVLSIAHNLSHPEFSDSFSEDPEAVKSHAAAMVRGLQGEPLSLEFLDYRHVVGLVAPFIGAGAEYNGNRFGNSFLSEEAMRNLYAPALQGVIEAGAQAVMLSPARWQGMPLIENKRLITDILKKNMGFSGFVIAELPKSNIGAGCNAQSCPQAILAGADMLVSPQNWRVLFDNTLKQVSEGVIPMERIRDAARRIIRVKWRAGLLSAHAPNLRRLSGDDGALSSPAQRELAENIIRRSTILLKNNGRILPIAPGRKILLIGEKSEEQAGLLSAFEKIADSYGGRIIFREQIKRGDSAELAVFIFREGKGVYSQLLQLRQMKIPVITIYIASKPAWVSREMNLSNAFIASFTPKGAMGAMAGLIFRKGNGLINEDFSGKLPFAWPAYERVNPYEEGVSQNLFAAGYGLSYAEHREMGELHERRTAMRETEREDVLLAAKAVLPWQAFLQERQAKPILVKNETLIAPHKGLFLGVLSERGKSFRSIKWVKTAPARFGLASVPARAVHGFAREGSLVFEMRMGDTKTIPASLSLQVKCGYGCGLAFPLKSHFVGKKAGQWQRFSVSLACAADRGLNPQKISEVFALYAKSPVHIHLGDIWLSEKKPKRKAIELCLP
ncbi:MAG: glycoside hydrolase family 3 N-terminal domain-containing protein, partial [Parvibaculales bacterium]